MRYRKVCVLSYPHVLTHVFASCAHLFAQVPTKLQRQVNEYFAYLWTCMRGLDETDVMGALPTSLRRQLIGTIFFGTGDHRAVHIPACSRSFMLCSGLVQRCSCSTENR